MAPADLDRIVLPEETVLLTVILAARVEHGATVDAWFVQCVRRLIEHGDAAALRSVPVYVKSVLRTFTNALLDVGAAIAGVNVLETAVAKLQLTPSALTFAHAKLLKLCLIARTYTRALPTLERDISDIDPVAAAIEPKDSLLYFYYGGMIYIGLKRYSEAFDLLLIAITSPAFALSAIVVEAFKKYLLVSLILHGKVLSLPNYTPSVVTRHVHKHAEEYVELEKAFREDRKDHLRDVFTRNLPRYKQDNNAGLAQQAVDSLYYLTVRRLNRTFVTLPLPGMADSLGVATEADAEAALLRMVERNLINVRINQVDKTVAFLSGSALATTASARDALHQSMQEVLAVADYVAQLDRRIATSDDYQARAMASDRSEGKAPVDPIDDGEGPYERMQSGMRMQ